MSIVEELWGLIDNGRKGKNVGLKTGLPKLDKVLGGIQMGKYLTVSALSSVGKTSFVLYILYRLLKDNTDQNIKAIYWSLELGSDVLLSKLLALYCAEEHGVYLTTIDMFSYESPVSDTNYQVMLKGKEWLKSIEDKLIIIDRGLSARTLYSDTLKIMKQFGTWNDETKKFVPKDPNQKIFGVIDHLLLVTPEQGRTLKEEMDLCSSYIVTLKRKLNMSWFVLMQQNRNASSVERRKMDLNEPGLADMMQSSAIANDSDIVMQLYSPFREKIPTYRDYNVLGPNGLGDRLRSCLVTKNRFGIANKVIPMLFYGEVGWWKDAPNASDITDAKLYLDIHTNIQGDVAAMPKKEITYNF